MSPLTRRAALSAVAAAGGCASLPQGETGSVGSRSYCLPRTVVEPLRSAINAVDYALYVRPAANPPAGGKKPPLIVTLDADYQFAIAANCLEHLAERAAQAPDAVLVSIAYDGRYAGRRLYRMNRTRDYTPIFQPDGGYGPELQTHSGGAPLFARVVGDEILPLVEARYGSDPNDRTLIGHSYGGLFGAWMLEAHPEMFSRYLLVSPSLWYGDRFILKPNGVDPPPRLTRPTRVYLAVGSREEQPENGKSMVSDLARFEAALAARGDPNLEVESRVFEDETHASIFPAAFSTGIRRLFANV